MKPFRVPLLLFALPAALAALSPAATPQLWLERPALGQGELWRLWTAHWVHFSASHLGWNLAALLGAGAWLERARPGWLLGHTLVAAPLTSLALLLVEPAMQAYGGLSALATGTVTLLALVQLENRRADGPLWTALLLLVVGKILYDAGHTTALFSRFDLPAVRASTFAHATGAVVAVALWPVWRQWHSPAPGEPGPS
jgi:rhomboid family GlyGly-CTERM serine protease